MDATEVPVVVALRRSPAWTALIVAVSEVRLPAWPSRSEAAAESVMFTAPPLVQLEVKPVPAVTPLRSKTSGNRLIVAVTGVLDSEPSLATRLTEIEAALNGAVVLL